MSQRKQKKAPSAGEQAEMELRGHFAGRRDGQRINVQLPVEVVCLRCNLSARTLNMSASGAMLQLLGEDRERSIAELMEYCEEVAQLFAAGGTIDFGCGVTRTMEVIRVAAGGLGGVPVPMLACRFKERLQAEDFVSMGLPPPSDEDVAAEASAGPAAEQRVTPAATSKKARKVPAIQELLRWAVDMEATDIHVKAGSPPRLRLCGSLNAVGEEAISNAEARTMIRNFLTDEQWAEFEEKGDLDVGYALEGIARFRINVLRTRNTICAVLRRIPEHVPSLDELGHAPVCKALSMLKRGLVLVTGGSGSGKSTTLAAMLHHINSHRPCHIVTLEDPIEYVHEENVAQITQREIGRDTEDFNTGLKRVLRQDPDVIMIGELRDLETIQLAVTAAETGHLVFATLHTTSATQTISRIADVFPAEKQRQIRVQLAATLQGVICQTLMPNLQGGIAVAQEILVVNDAVRAHIRDAKTPQLRNVIQTGAADGMQSLEDSLNDMVRRNIISLETAVEFANTPQHIIGMTTAQVGEGFDPEGTQETEDEEAVEETPRRASWVRR